MVQTKASSLQLLNHRIKNNTWSLLHSIAVNNKTIVNTKETLKLWRNEEKRKKRLKYNELRNGPRDPRFQHQLCWLWSWTKHLFSRFHLSLLWNQYITYLKELLEIERIISKFNNSAQSMVLNHKCELSIINVIIIEKKILILKISSNEESQFV